MARETELGWCTAEALDTGHGLNNMDVVLETQADVRRGVLVAAG